MPLYEYECTACSHRFERRQGFHEDPIGVCPWCQGRSRRILQPIPTIFKGSGFYVTDNRKAEPPESTGMQEKAEPKIVDKAEPKTEAKKDEGAPAKSG